MISIILPSVRPSLLRECLDSISKAGNHVDFEVIVVADYESKDCNEFIPYKPCRIKWIHTPERKGVVDAINKGVESAGGEYLFSLSDEAILGENSLLYLETVCRINHDMALITPNHLPTFPFYYYNKAFAPFPFMHRKLIEKVGYFIDPAYKAFYADPDLSMKVWSLGHQVITAKSAWINHPNNMSCPAHVHNVNSYLLQDRETFRKRWDHLGEFRDP